MIDENLKSQLSTYLGNLRRPITVKGRLDQSERSDKTRDLLETLRAASSLVTIEVEAGPSHERAPSVPSQRRPSFTIRENGEPERVEFAGLPLGHELGSLILALLHVGGHPPKEAEEVLEAVRSLQGPFHFETYFSQSCQNCPDVVQAFNTMAALNPNITHVAIDGASFQSEVNERQVMAVPSVFMNGEPFFQGRKELAEIVALLDDQAEARAAESLKEKDVFDVLVVGGGPAGASAAVYAARKGIKTGVVVDRFGGQVQDTLAIENYVSVLETDGPRLSRAFEAHVAAYPVDVMKHQRARALRGGSLIEVELESGVTLQAKSVVLATGARYRDMNVPGEAEYRTRGVTYCPHCDGPLFKGKRVAVIGGGNSGVEAAIDLAGIVEHVTLVEFAESLKADGVLLAKLNSLSNIEVFTSSQVKEVVGDGQKVIALRVEDRTNGESRDIPVAGVFVQIGLLPNTGWLQGSVELSKFGEIVVGAKGETSVPGVYAAGDATNTPFKQIIIAAGDGAKAALGAFEYLIRSAPEAA